MASPSHTLLNLSLLTLCLATFVVVLGGSSSFLAEAHQLDDTSLKLMSDAFEWPTTMSMYDELAEDEDEDMDGGFVDRRSLFWRRSKYYISYGALSANRIPCPPRSGRSYYTNNCFKARGPVHPYTRGCSIISRCRR